MSRPWWQTRDPDLPRDRDTKALGHRDWNWFTTYDGSAMSPADLEPATSPWSAADITIKDRYDRTLGIPSRHHSMWAHLPPTLTGPPDPPPPAPDRSTVRVTRGASATIDARRRDAATDVIHALHSLRPAPSPVRVSPRSLTRLLDTIAPAVHGRSPAAQYSRISGIAHDHGLPPAAVLALARDTGTMILKTTHVPVPAIPGEAALNRLLHADRTLAAELLLARARLTWAQTHSDPDMPRLWILLNGLHHAVPAEILLTQPAHSHGPIAEHLPTHNDLIGWHGITTALTELTATLTAATEGRTWLTTTHTHTNSANDRLLALGILQLTHPRTAQQLVLAGPAAITVTNIQTITATLPTPTHVLDLSDTALKAICDRHGWMLGTADERTQRELIERHARPALADPTTRARLADGDLTALTDAITHHAPTDTDLDNATWRHDPPAIDATHQRIFLDRASRHALHELAGHDVTPHQTRAAALAARFPSRLAERGLNVHPEQLLTAEAASPQAAPFFQTQTQLDLGF